MINSTPESLAGNTTMTIEGNDNAELASSRSSSRVRARRRRTLLVVGAVGLAWFGSGLPSQTWIATTAVAVPALGVVILALRRPPEAGQRPARLRLGITCWSVLIVVGVVWELWIFSRQPAWNIPNPDYPTLTQLLNAITEHRAGRFAAWLLWLYTGARLTR